MTRRYAAATGLAALLALALLGTARAQEPEAAPAAEPQATPAPKPRPKPRPKLRPKPAPKPEAPKDAVDPKPDAKSDSKPDSKSDAKSGDVRRAEPAPEGGTSLAPDGAAGPEAASPATAQTAIVAPPVACDPGQSVLYDGANGFSLWVTRAGSVTIDNPLRPLTPEVTRVLQLVIAGKLATAYGADLGALRRGGAPGVLEASLGGPIRWDATLGTLPDTLSIVADSGAALAAMRFKECGEAPAVKAAPVARARKGGRAGAKTDAKTGESTNTAKTGETGDPAKDKAEKPRAPRRPPAADQGGPPNPRAAAPGTRQFNVPQGAISE